jgi:hypothetical protein
MRCQQTSTRAALVAHLLGLGLGTATVIGLTPAALTLARV